MPLLTGRTRARALGVFLQGVQRTRLTGQYIPSGTTVTGICAAVHMSNHKVLCKNGTQAYKLKSTILNYTQRSKSPKSLHLSSQCIRILPQGNLIQQAFYSMRGHYVFLILHREREGQKREKSLMSLTISWIEHATIPSCSMVVRVSVPWRLSKGFMYPHLLMHHQLQFMTYIYITSPHQPFRFSQNCFNCDNWVRSGQFDRPIMNALLFHLVFLWVFFAPPPRVLSETTCYVSDWLGNIMSSS